MSPSARPIRVVARLLIPALSLVFAACGNEDRDPMADAGADAPLADTSVDAPPDAPGDVSDVDPGTDTGPDAPMPAWTPCDGPSECVLAANTCCGVCGQPELGDVDGIHVLDRDTHYALVCDDPNPICPGCPSMLNPWLIAECVDAACTATDVREDPVTACSTDDECVLRAPDCCTCGALMIPEALIALRADAEMQWRSRVCDPDVDCATCEPEYPGYVRAACSTDGRCFVEYLED